MAQDIKERTFDFALRIINLSNHLPRTRVGNILGNQVLRAGTSIGANVEEAEAAYTKESFSYKMNIALSEARETHHWLRLLKKSKIVKPSRLDDIINEAEQLKKILGAIVSKARGKSKQ
jgi:four helix bundle protein